MLHNLRRRGAALFFAFSACAIGQTVSPPAGAPGPTGPSGSNGATGPTGATGATGAGSGISFVSYGTVVQGGSVVGGSNFDLLATGPTGATGTAAVCSNPDGGNGLLDGECQFAASTTNYVAGHFYLGSATTTGTNFVDGVKATVTNFNSTATSGSAQFTIYSQCVAVGAVASTSGYGSGANFNSIAMKGTASGLNQTNTLTLTTGCTANEYFYWMIGLVNSLASTVNVKNVLFAGTGIVK